MTVTDGAQIIAALTADIERLTGENKRLAEIERIALMMFPEPDQARGTEAFQSVYTNLLRRWSDDDREALGRVLAREVIERLTGERDEARTEFKAASQRIENQRTELNRIDARFWEANRMLCHVRQWRSDAEKERDEARAEANSMYRAADNLSAFLRRILRRQLPISDTLREQGRYILREYGVGGSILRGEKPETTPATGVPVFAAPVTQPETLGRESKICHPAQITGQVAP